MAGNVNAIGDTSPTPASEETRNVGRYESFIDQRLASTRRQIKTVELITALITLSIGVLGYLLLGAMIDSWMFTDGFGTFGRTLVLFGLLGIVVYYVWRRIIPPLIFRINPVFAARVLEGSQPKTKNSLINFLLLRREKEVVPRIVYDAVQHKAASDISRIELDNAIDRHVALNRGYVLAGILCFSIIYLAFSPRNPMTSAMRIIMPWADIPAPSSVEIDDIQPGDTIVMRGEPVDISARIHGMSGDETAMLHYFTDDQQIVDQIVPMRFSAKSRRYEGTLPPSDKGAQQDGWYYIKAGDAKSVDYRIDVIPAPTITVASVKYNYPKYTGLPSKTVDRHGDLRALEGTDAIILAKTNMEFERAEIDLGEGRRPIVMKKVDKNTATGLIRLEFDPTDPSRPMIDQYRLRMTDLKKRRNRNPVLHSVEVIRDLPPDIRITAPKKEDITLPLDRYVDIAIEAVDPDFALRRVQLKANTAEGAVPIKPLLNIANHGKPHEDPFCKVFRFSPQQLKLKPGDTVTYWAEAEDSKLDEPNRSITTRRTIRIEQPIDHQSGDDNQQPGEQPQNAPGENGQDQSEKGQDQSGQDQAGQDQAGQDQSGQDQAGQDQSGDQSGQQSGDQSGQQSGDQSGQQSGDQSGQQSGDQSGQQSGDQSGQQSGDQSGQQSGDQSGQQSGDQSGQQSGDQSGQQSGDQSGQQSGDQSGQQSGDQSGQQSGNQSGQQSGDQSGQQSGDQPGSQPGSNGSQQYGQRSGGKVDPNTQAADAFEEILEDMNQENSQSQNGQSGGQPDGQQNQKPGGQSGDQPQSSNNQSGNQDSNSQTGQSDSQSQENSGASSQQGESQPGESGDQSNESSGGQQDQNAQGGDSSEQQPSSSGGEEAQSSGSSKSDSEQSGNQNQQKNSSGGGNEKTDQGGSGAPEEQGENRPKSGSQPNSGSQQKKPDDGQGSSPSNSKNQTETIGDQSGDKSGDGEEGGGQKSQKDGQGAAGSHQEADTGGDPASTPGEGEDGSGAGNSKMTDQQTGNTTEKPPGEQGRAGDNSTGQGEAPRGDNPTGRPNTQNGQGSGTTGESGNESEDQQAQNDANRSEQEQDQMAQNDQTSGTPEQPEQQPGQRRESEDDRAAGAGGSNGSPLAGGKPGKASNNPESSIQQQMGSDAANRRYADEQTSLALEHLKDQVRKGDKSLLKKLGWTPDEAKRFIQHWENLKKNAGSVGQPGENQQTYEEALKNLGLRPRGMRTTTTGGTDQMQRIQDAGRYEPPAQWMEHIRAYRRGVATGDL